MCVVSMIYDYGRTIHDDNWAIIPYPGTSGNITTTTRSPLDIFDELVRLAGELDRALGLADCEDPSKAKWLDRVREQVRKHERKRIDQRLGAQEAR
jgi:hypothetical protein